MDFYQLSKLVNQYCGICQDMHEDVQRKLHNNFLSSYHTVVVLTTTSEINKFCLAW